MKLIVVLVAVLAVASAQREDALAVIEKLREIQPYYWNFTTCFIGVVADAKINASNILSGEHSEIINAKEKYVKSAIDQKDNITHQIDSQSPETNKVCLDYLRVIVNRNFLLSGIQFSNCIISLDDKLNEEITRLYNKLDKDGPFQNTTIYDVFQGQNIFNDSKPIIALLESKQAALQCLPDKLVEQFLKLLEEFRGRLAPITSQYRTCLTKNDQLLQDAMSVVRQQLLNACQGVVAPVSTDVPEIDEPTSTTAATSAPVSSKVPVASIPFGL